VPTQRRSSPDEARERLLGSGERLLASHARNAPERFFEGFRGVLTAAAITESADYGSHAVINRLWGGQTDSGGKPIPPLRAFMLDLAERLSVGVYDLPFLEEHVRAASMTRISWNRTVAEIADVELDRLYGGGAGGDQWLLWLTLAPYAMGGPIHSAYNGESLKEQLGRLADLYEFTLHLWARRMRKGLSARDLAEALSAAADGFTLHRRLERPNGESADVGGPAHVTAPRQWTPPHGDSDGASWTVWSIAVWGIVEAMTEAE
jgi:hypothetical protein